MHNERLSEGAISQEDVRDINALIEQLTENPVPIDRARASEIARHSIWVVVRDDDDRIRGMGLLTLSHITTGTIGHIADVVTDFDYRGRGVGKTIVQELIAYARHEGATKIELTSKPIRIAANSLYLQLGFVPKQTNHYVLAL
jgi:GNAT superfamily N-acetyltransferase